MADLLVVLKSRTPKNGTMSFAGSDHDVCHGQARRPGTTRIAVERGPTVLVVRGVPAQAYDNCGEACLSADAVDRLQHILAVAALRTSRGPRMCSASIPSN